MTHIKRKGGVTSTSPIQYNLQSEYYHRNNDNVNIYSEENYNSKHSSKTDSTESEFNKKSEELHKLVKSLDACGFGVRINHLCKKFGVSREILKQIRKEVVEEVKSGYDRRASLLVEDTEPSESAVTMAEALDLIYSTLKRYIIADEALLVRASLWIAHTYFVDELFVSPICLITSPQSNCGKSLLTTVMMEMCNRSFPITASITEAAMFRIIEECMPTIALDEADLNLQKNPALQGILNAGHMRSTAWTFRCDPNNSFVEKFKTFCPKIISGIRSTQIRDTLTNRSIILSMRRKRKNESCECFLYSEARQAFAQIRRKIKRASIDAIENGSFDLSETIKWPVWMDDGRARDNWNPLFHIALTAGQQWLDRAIEASRDDEDTLAQIDYEKQLLTELLEIFEENEKDYFTTTELVDALLKKDADWRYANNGQPINVRWLSMRLSSYGVKSTRTRLNGVQVRIYLTKDMRDAFVSYVKDDSSEDEVNESQVLNVVTKAEDAKLNQQIATDCLDVAKDLQDNYVTPTDYANLLIGKKVSWKPKESRTGEITANWLKKKLASWNIHPVRTRIKHSQLRCYQVPDLIQSLTDCLKKFETELAELLTIPVVIESA